MWIVLSQIICIAAAIGLLAIVHDLGKETSPFIRYGLILLSAAFIGVFGAGFSNREIYAHATAISFTGVGAMTIAVVFHLSSTQHIQPIALKISGGALGLVLFVWLIGSCSDIKRQQIQIEDASVPQTAAPIVPADSTQQAITDFKRYSK